MDNCLGLSGAAWTGIYTIITFGLLVVAVVAALYAKKQWQIGREQAADARKAQMEASRPYVIVTIEPSGADWRQFDLVVKNIGGRPALSVSIALDPPPMRAFEIAGHEIANAKMLNEPVAMIAPGQEMRTLYDSHDERNGREDLAGSHLVSLAYQDSSQHDYAETSVLDIDAMKGTMSTAVQTTHDIGQTLEKMQKTLDSASLLQRSGTVAVAASIESHAEHQQRLAEERAEREERRDVPGRGRWTYSITGAPPRYSMPWRRRCGAGPPECSSTGCFPTSKTPRTGNPDIHCMSTPRSGGAASTIPATTSGTSQGTPRRPAERRSATKRCGAQRCSSFP